MPQGTGTEQGRRAATMGAVTVGGGCPSWLRSRFYGCATDCAPIMFEGVTLNQNSETMAACTRGKHMRPSSPIMEFPGVDSAILA